MKHARAARPSNTLAVHLSDIPKPVTDGAMARLLDWPHSRQPPEQTAEDSMNYLISLAIGITVGLAYYFLDFRSPAPPLVALVGLLGMQIGENALPLLSRWLH
jgi:XapX domain-containing protein